ncbi:hypothetical protein [Embleya hyalina]|uniref:Uncharacterized protein n=1 Tax=Embleya hyalina TaxID=516124 RepID=A0A401YTD7_9ACTN|nr:hypothetical protein [Embleya hyalina]GCD97888.1 hypothetical protein EHYA_05585 [Embleya hyalina]
MTSDTDTIAGAGDWLHLRDTIDVDGELSKRIRAENPAPGARLVLIAREITHEPGFVLRAAGHPVLLVAESHRGNGGGIDADAVTALAATLIDAALTAPDGARVRVATVEYSGLRLRADPIPAPRTHTEDSWWAEVHRELGPAYTRAWAEYRTRMGEFLFRADNPRSSGHADDRFEAAQEFRRALVLCPRMPRPAELLRHLENDLTADGEPYDVAPPPDLAHQDWYTEASATFLQASFTTARNLALFVMGKPD